MAGNEIEIAKYLVLNKGKISLKHLGVINSIGAPNLSKSGYMEVKNDIDVEHYLSTEYPGKKADIY